MHLALIRPLLRLSEHYPPGWHDRQELGVASEAEFRSLLISGLLQQRPPPSLVNDALVVFQEGRCFLVPADPWEEVEEVEPESLHPFEIDFRVLACLFRNAFDLQGPPVRELTPFLYWLGSRSTGADREGVCLARGRAAGDLLDLLGVARVHEPAPRWTLLTPTDWAPAANVLMHLEHFQTRVLALEGLVDGARDTITLPAFRLSGPRMSVDEEGRTVTLDGDKQVLPSREAAVLAALAREAVSEAGVVSRDRLAKAIEDATGSRERQHEEQIDTVMSRLRSRLGDPDLIRTHRRSGYSLQLSAAEVEVF